MNLTASREKFISRVEMIPEAGCWIWMGAVSPINGYARICVPPAFRTAKSKVMNAHRYSWLIFRGPISTGLHVCHRCDLRCCVNPNHMFLGTAGDNIRDCFSKGRGNPGRMLGETNPSAKLTAEEVQEIRNSTDITANLARKHNVTWATVKAARTGVTWQHDRLKEIVAKIWEGPSGL